MFGTFKSNRMKRRQVEIETFPKTNNSTYSICFLGSNSNAIFKKEGILSEVDKLSESIFFQFLATEKLCNLNIITNGSSGEGIPERVTGVFKHLRDHFVLPEDTKKEIQLIALTSFTGKRVRVSTKIEGIKEIAITKDDKLYIANDKLNRNNDYYLVVEDELSQMINLSNLFIILPGGKDTLGNFRFIYDYLVQLADDELCKYRILLHPFWKEKFKEEVFPHWCTYMGEEICLEKLIESSYLVNNKRKEFITSFSQYKNRVTQLTNIKELTEKIIYSFFTMPLLKTDDIRKNAILAVDFTYWLDNDLTDKKIYKEIYCRRSYAKKLNKFYKNGGNYLFGVEEGKNDEYKVIKFPNAKLQEADNIHYQKPLFEYKEGCNLFEDFANYWKEEEYGQTLVWKYNRIARKTSSDDTMIFSIVLLFNHILPEQILEDLRSMLDQFILSFSSKKVSEYFHNSNQELQKREQKVYERSVRHAISQVFVRNMSHNIISHVLVNLQSEESLKKANLQEIINKGAYEGIDIENKDKVLSIEYQLAALNKYISNRCLYLNEATYAVSNFVESKKVYKDLFKGLDENRILLNLISAVDNFKYRFCFLYEEHNPYGIREITEENDIAVMIPGGVLGQQAFYNIIENMIRNTAKHNASKVSREVVFKVKFSETVVPRVFLSSDKTRFISNILRYHRQKQELLEDRQRKLEGRQRKLELRKKGYNIYELSENEEEIEEVKGLEINEDEVIIDKKRQLSIGYFKKKYGEDWFSITEQVYERMYNTITKYYEVEIFDDIVIDEVEAEKLVKETLNKKIFGEVLEGDILRTHSLGLLEMKASAAFLRQIDIAKVDQGLLSYTDEAMHIPFIEAIYRIVEGGANVGYRFFLKKVEKYLIVCHLKEDYQEKIAKWSAIGIELISVEDFLGKIGRKESFSHEFALLLTQEAKEEVGAIGEYFYSSHKEKRKNRRNDRIPELSLLPERLIYIEEDFLSEVGETQIEEFFSQKIWEQWEGIRKKEKENYLAINTKTILKTTGRFANYDDCKQVVFHNHLYSMKDWEDMIEGMNDKNKDEITVEPLSSAAQRKLPYFDIYQSSLDNYVAEIRENDKYFVTQQLIEAYFNKAIVIDERIQKFASTPFFTEGNQTLYQRDIFDYINVLIPKVEEVDLNNESLSKEHIQRIEGFITKNIPESEFLVVHYGLFERIYGKENHNEILNSKLLEWSKMIRTIVVTGRGQHTLEGLPEAVNYLNLSSLLDAFRDNRNKYSINYILNQTRR